MGVECWHMIILKDFHYKMHGTPQEDAWYHEKGPTIRVMWL